MSKLHDKIKALLNKTTSNGCTEAEALPFFSSTATTDTIEL